MPQVTPNRTNHLRQSATFRGTSQRGSELKALVRANRRKKRKLINEACAAASADLIAAGTKLVRIKRQWNLVGSGGQESDARAAHELENVYATFAVRGKAVRARAIGRSAKPHERVSVVVDGQVHSNDVTQSLGRFTGANERCDRGDQPDMYDGRPSGAAPPPSHPTKGSNE